MLEKEGLQSEVVKEGDSKSIAGFRVQALEAPHGELPIPRAHNTAFLINESFLDTGDSIEVSGVERVETLALPVAGPWLTLLQALAFADKLKPKHVIPVHEGVYNEFMSKRVHQLAAPYAKEKGWDYQALQPDQTLEV